MLRKYVDQGGGLLDINYGEVVGTSSAINVPLNNEKINNVSINSIELDQWITRNNSISPAKVTVIYDLDNNIVNSDFAVDGDWYGDGIYDSEQTIIDNALNTLIFNQDAKCIKNIFNKNS